MTTMLEKLARAVATAHYTPGWEGDILDLMVDDDWPDFLPEARAVLTALREPDEGMVDAAKQAFVERGPIAFADFFTAMIDHILNGDTNA